MTKVSKRGIWLGASLLCLICLIAGMRAPEVTEDKEAEVFSEEDSFCQEGTLLTIAIPGMSEIYYTQDGTAPSREALLYQEPVALTASGNGIRGCTIRAVGYNAGGEPSAEYVRTYFPGENPEECFSTWIVAITSDPDNLYGEDNGILVGGRMKREYMENHPDEPETAAPANYYLRGRGAEREAYVEIFNEKGERLVSQHMGLRVHGGVSRSLDQKSLRLIARKDYGKDTFDVPLFEGNEQQSYKKFVLRNSGNDYQHAFMRNECALTLFKEAGFPDTTRFRPAAVFLNGEYYGFQWITELYDDCYFHSHYGTTENQGSWQVLDVKNRLLEPEDPEDLSMVQAVDDWNEIYTLCTTKDLTNDYVFQEFAARVDVENFLLYHFMEIYLANPDWPFNNNKVYRWYQQQRLRGEKHGRKMEISDL